MSLAASISTFELVSAQNARRQWGSRQGVGLEIRTAEGIVGFGEASPLSGYSPETFGQAKRALVEWSRHPPMVDLAGSDVMATISGHVRDLPRALPSVRFAVESALIDIASQQRGIAARELLGGPVQGSYITLAKLVGPAATIDFRAVPQWLGAGFETLKIKIGARGRFRAEIGALKQLRRIVGPKIRLRVDANGGLGGNLADELDQLGAIGVEMVEEPVSGLRLLHLGPVPVAVAIDETLIEIAQGRIAAEELRASQVDVLVLKPMVLGGLIACGRLAAEAHARGAKCLVSHLFDGPIAMAGYCSLAATLPSRELAMGLAPHPGLRMFPTLTIDGLEGAEIRHPRVPGLPLIREHRR